MSEKIYLPIGPQPIQPSSTGRNQRKGAESTGPSFQEVLQGVVSPAKVRFSAHAEKRLQTRGISFDAQKMEQLSQAIEKVESKGGKESLVILDDVALIVSVKNRTVITAIDGESLKENVFTNIDSAIIS